MPRRHPPKRIPATSPSTAFDLPEEGLVLGPILGLENKGDATFLTCCIVWRGPLPDGKLTWVLNGAEAVPFKVASPLHHGAFLRAEILCPGTGPLRHQILADDEVVPGCDGKTEWVCHPPPETAMGFRFAYASCNGFSAAKLLAQNKDPYGMWRRLRDEHAQAPYHLLAMGGDQIYADSVWEQPWMAEFNDLDFEASLQAKVTPDQTVKLEVFYESLYLRQWRRPEVAAVMAQVPSIMMWDDHDIFDGWGSFPKAQQESDVFQAIYRAASHTFELFQLRAATHSLFLGGASRTYDFTLTVAETTFLVLDNRSRRTRERLVPDEQWASWKTWIEAFSGQRLFVMTGVPVIYRRFAAAEAWMAFTPWQEELEDDLLDHWSAAPHQKDRVRLIYNLVNRQAALQMNGSAQWAFLSGDVHVGGVGVVWDERLNCGLYQLISSGIAHPPPSALQWKAVQLTSSDAPEAIGDGDMTARLLVPTGAAANYIRARNFLSSHVGSDRQLWFEWICEDGQRPIFTIKP